MVVTQRTLNTSITIVQTGARITKHFQRQVGSICDSIRRIGNPFLDDFRILHQGKLWFPFVTASPFLLFCSSSLRAFPIMLGHRNGFEYHSSTLSCPMRPPHLAPQFPYLINSHPIFCLSLRFFPGKPLCIDASNILLSTCPSPCHV